MHTEGSETLRDFCAPQTSGAVGKHYEEKGTGDGSSNQQLFTGAPTFVHGGTEQ